MDHDEDLLKTHSRDRRVLIVPRTFVAVGVSEVERVVVVSYEVLWVGSRFL